MQWQEYLNKARQACKDFGYSACFGVLLCVSGLILNWCTNTQQVWQERLEKAQFRTVLTDSLERAGELHLRQYRDSAEQTALQRYRATEQQNHQRKLTDEKLEDKYRRNRVALPAL